MSRDYGVLFWGRRSERPPRLPLLLSKLDRQLGGKACSDMYRGTGVAGAGPSFARLGPFDFAQGRLSRAPVPTRAVSTLAVSTLAVPATSLIFSIPLGGLAIYLG